MLLGVQTFHLSLRSARKEPKLSNWEMCEESCLIQNEQIRTSHQHSCQLQSPAFSSAEHPNLQSQLNLCTGSEAGTVLDGSSLKHLHPHLQHILDMICDVFGAGLYGMAFRAPYQSGKGKCECCMLTLV